MDRPGLPLYGVSETGVSSKYQPRLSTKPCPRNHFEQADIGGNDWEATHMKVNLRGKALMVKSLSIQITQQASHYSLVPPGVDYRKAIQLLKGPGPTQ